MLPSPAFPQLYWSKGELCCQDVRAILGCSPVTDEPCREYAGDCGLLMDQFMELVPELQTWECTQFPSDTMPGDKVLAGLIMAAIAFATKGVVERLFERSNSSPAPEVLAGSSAWSDLLHR